MEPVKAPTPVKETGLKALERELIVKALQDCRWNQTKAARQLAISRKTLLYRMAKYGVTRDESSTEQNSKTETRGKPSEAAG